MAGPAPDRHIPRIAADALSYQDFCKTFMLANQPVLVTGVTSAWRATAEWRTREGRPNLSHFKAKYGASRVQVADCGQQHFSDQERLSMTVADFVDYWEKHRIFSAEKAQSQHEEAKTTRSSPVLSSEEVASTAMTSQTEESVCVFRSQDSRGDPFSGSDTGRGAPQTMSKGLERRTLYLKDWHFVAEYPEYEAYETPVYFQDDWLNEYLDKYPMQYEAAQPRRTDPCSQGIEACEQPPSFLKSEKRRSESTETPPNATQPEPTSETTIASGVQNGSHQCQCETSTERIFTSGMGSQHRVECAENAMEHVNTGNVGSQNGVECAENNPERVNTSELRSQDGVECAENSREPIHTSKVGSREEADIAEKSREATDTSDVDSRRGAENDRERSNSGEVGSQNGVECADYRFVYMGPAGSWTPCHADVLRSYSWSVNVCGRKRWRLLSADQAHMLYDRHGRSTVYSIDEPVDSTRFPLFSQTRWLECTQEAGEAIFVPSGWFHQVTNLEDTISINHNWLNGFNLHWAWKLLQEDYKDTVTSIEDCRPLSTPEEFEGLCQRNLQLNSGTNFLDFFAFVATIALDRARKLRYLLRSNPSECSSGSEANTKQHDASNLQQLVAGLKNASRVLEELSEQSLFGASSDISLVSTKDGQTEQVLDLPRSKAIARGPRTIAQAIGSVLEEAASDKWVGREELHLNEVVKWR